MSVSTGTPFPGQCYRLDNVSSTVTVKVLSTHQLNSYRKTNSGLRGVWVYEIGTSPYFTNVAPGEVSDLPAEATPNGAPDGYDDATDAGRPVYTDGQQVRYPPYEPEGGQIEVHPVQYQPHQPENPEVVVVVDDTDINVDGESTAERLCFLFCIV